ncbi:hypothetical protein [Nocardia sp. R6R-6]|uniref:hypothetical protein n=1 Tax=Nocardia sp. R6R-6 TaxID=3459303 RepID=UPI00403DE2DD
MVDAVGFGDPWAISGSAVFAPAVFAAAVLFPGPVVLAAVIIAPAITPAVFIVAAMGRDWRRWRGSVIAGPSPRLIELHDARRSGRCGHGRNRRHRRERCRYPRHRDHGEQLTGGAAVRLLDHHHCLSGETIAFPASSVNRIVHSIAFVTSHISFA